MRGLKLADFMGFSPRRSYMYRVPIEPPQGARELHFFESCTIAALPDTFKRFSGETGLGFLWRSKRAMANKDPNWHYNKIRHSLVKLGLIEDPTLVFCIGARIIDTLEDPQGLIVITEE